MRRRARRRPDVEQGFTGRVAVVTGAGSGIGRALALQLAAAGARLALSDVDEAGLSQTCSAARARGATVRSDRLDVTDRAGVFGYADSVAAALGGVDVVVNNAGVLHVGMVLDSDITDLERVMDVNFWGVVHGSTAFLPHLIASGRGNLVNLSSLFGLVPVPTQSAYVAAKHAVHGFTESLRIELRLAGHPVAVTCVHPGGVDTPIARRATRSPDAPRPSARSALRMPPDKAAATILRGVARDRARVLVGRDAAAVHLLSRLSLSAWPRLVALAYRKEAAVRDPDPGRPDSG
ncbi:MAG TPA: SDR family NAD(P)-dependent oxidoreductase [Propionibacteriaceae bacterium]